MDPRVPIRALAYVAAGLIAALGATAARAEAPRRYTCPMHAEVQRLGRGSCPRCGMRLVAVDADRPYEPYTLEVTTAPAQPLHSVALTLQVHAPGERAGVRAFAVVHDHPLHLFLLSQDLDWFAHVHPTLDAEGRFTLTQRFPGAGAYHLIADFVPEGGPPQLIRRVVMVTEPSGRANVAGSRTPLLHGARLPRRDVTRHEVDGITAVLTSDPLVATRTTSVQIAYRAAGGAVALEPYLGAAVHVVVVSEDLAEVLHVHGDRIPSAPGDADERVRFEMCFPRAGTYRLWAQVGRGGGVHTAVFTVRVQPMARAD